MLPRLNQAEKIEALEILFKHVRPDLDPGVASLNTLSKLPHDPDNVSSLSSLHACYLFALHYVSHTYNNSRCNSMVFGLPWMSSRLGKTKGMCMILFSLAAFLC